MFFSVGDYLQTGIKTVTNISKRILKFKNMLTGYVSDKHVFSFHFVEGHNKHCILCPYDDL